MPAQITNCSLEIFPNYRCVICDKRIHRGDSGCICSTFRPESFQYASICVKCVKAFDRLLADVELQPILMHLLRREYYRGVGPVIDF